MRDFAKQLVSQFNSDTDSTDNYFRVFTFKNGGRLLKAVHQSCKSFYNI